MGSGTTAVVAKEMGIKYIGFEICEEYVEIANKRLNSINSETIIEKKTDKNFDAEEYKHKEKNVEQMVLKMDDI